MILPRKVQYCHIIGKSSVTFHLFITLLNQCSLDKKLTLRLNPLPREVYFVAEKPSALKTVAHPRGQVNDQILYISQSSFIIYAHTVTVWFTPFCTLHLIVY